MADVQEPRAKEHWQIARELPPNVFAVLRKTGRAINPITVVATVDEDGTPRTAPFGSLRAVTPRLLRLACLRFHGTYANLCRDGRATVALLAPPDIAVSIRGRARAAKEHMDTDEYYAAVEIEVEEVKNDMMRRGSIESAITLHIPERYIAEYLAAIDELEAM